MLNELKKKLQFNEKESKLYIPNEIFNDIQMSVSEGGSSSIAFAYSYYYLVTWMYRYAKYGCYLPDQKFMKNVLGYNEKYQGMDYLIKKNGVLDQIGYTETVKDYPITWTFDDDYLEFTMLSDMEEDVQEVIRKQVSRKYTVKYPVKAFYRWESDDMDGTFYQFENTHEIPFEVFLFSMSKEDIGCIGFYLWSYLKMKNQIHKDGYDISIDDLSQEVKIPKSTMIEYLNRLRGYRMITCYYNQEFFCVALSDDEKQANTYVTNKWSEFSSDKIGYQKLKFVSKKEYRMMKSEKVEIGELF